MTCPKISKTLVLAYLSLSLATLSACGVDQDQHYNDKKNYGREPENQNDGINVNNNNDDLDPNLLAFKGFYKGYMNADSLRLLKTVDGVPQERTIESIGTLGNVMSMVLPFLSKPADLTVSQTVGDIEKSFFTQALISPSDDSMIAKIVDGPSDTRDQEFKRVIGLGACPTSFVCIAEQNYAAKSGEKKKFCYYDHASGQLTAVPYTPAPQSKAKDFEEAFRTYPAYVSVEFTNNNIPDVCPATLSAAQTRAGGTEIFKVSVSRAPVPTDLERNAQNPELIPIQYGMNIRMQLYTEVSGGRLVERDLNSLPYIDDKLMTQGETTYYLNEDHEALVLFTKTIRKTLRKSVSGALRFVPGMSDLLSHDGLKLNYQFEFCQDRTDSIDKGPDLCKKPE